MGKIVLSEDINIYGSVNKNISLQNLEKGIYFISLNKINDNKLIKKIIVH